MLVIILHVPTASPLRAWSLFVWTEFQLNASLPGSDCKMAQPPTPAGQEPFPDPCNLIVNYIPTPVTDAELHAMFSQYGELVSARVIIDRGSGHPKGYGFVKFKNVADANRAMMNMTGFIIHGKRLKVTPARGFQSASIENYINRSSQPSFMPQPQIVAPMPAVWPGHPVMAPPPVMQQYHLPEEYVSYDWIPTYSGPSFEIPMSQFGVASPPLSMEHPSNQSAQPQIAPTVPPPPPSF